MAIASTMASTLAKNADGTLMGIHQIGLNAGLAAGPIVGAMLLQVNLFAPFLYTAVCEVLALALNGYVYGAARKSGNIDRRLLCLTHVAPPAEAGVAQVAKSADEPTQASVALAT